MKINLASGERSVRGNVQQNAFSMLEVIIACAIFFMVAFSLLQMVTTSLKAARSLQVRHPDPGMVLAALSLTNALEEGSISGDYDEIAPGTYKGYRWEAFIEEIGSNGLFKIEVLTYNEKKPGVEPATTMGHFWRPYSKPGSATKGRP